VARGDGEREEAVEGAVEVLALLLENQRRKAERRLSVAGRIAASAAGAEAGEGVVGIKYGEAAACSGWEGMVSEDPVKCSCSS
jgi:hypothetical protein